MTAIESAEMERLVEAYPHLEEKANLLELVMLAINSGEAPAPDSELPYVFSNSSIYDEMSHLLKPGERHAAIH